MPIGACTFNSDPTAGSVEDILYIQQLEKRRGEINMYVQINQAGVMPGRIFRRSSS